MRKIAFQAKEGKEAPTADDQGTRDGILLEWMRMVAGGSVIVKVGDDRICTSKIRHRYGGVEEIDPEVEGFTGGGNVVSFKNNTEDAVKRGSTETHTAELQARVSRSCEF
ncbi:hypothetical protein V6N12_000421 [Hibiscus sabdariffa]|uniref:Uncharacterized protein n=1 Tax=Hibiscus sabdariffa TaxID=183260 RepID=A0ABR2BI47_9ROSI